MNLSTLITFLVLTVLAHIIGAQSTAKVNTPALPFYVWVPLLIVGVIVMCVLAIAIIALLLKMFNVRLFGKKTAMTTSLLSDDGLNKSNSRYSNTKQEGYIPINTYTGVDTVEKNLEIVDFMKEEEILPKTRTSKDLVTLKKELEDLDKIMSIKKAELRLSKDRLGFKEKDEKCQQQLDAYNKMRQEILFLRSEEAHEGIDNATRQQIREKRMLLEEEFYNLPHDEIDILERLKTRTEKLDQAFNELKIQRMTLESDIDELERQAGVAITV
jgi:flagellar basal body-associated protein FliL